MSVYQCWVAQKQPLREALPADAQGISYQLRHALAQVEQNAMAEQPDDLLRQQTGILFSCFKTSLNLLDISVTTKVWVAQSHKEEKKRSRPAAWWFSIACAVQLVAGLFAYAKGTALIWIPLASSLVSTIVGWIVAGRAPGTAAIPEDRLKVTAKPDTEKLFQAVDAQMKAIDRFINDFAYLNEQNALKNSSPDIRRIASLAELMQAVYECDGEAGEEAVAAAEKLLLGSGARAVSYTPEAEAMFNILPSLSQTRTLTPALVSQKDGTLLYRGTAAVLQATRPLPADAASDSQGE
ncbi:MAG: hypothetical protein PHY64_10565 [Eubacteriales bacterium]|nr:hypothetical protein [Eubacteriales bacterium]